MSSLTIELKSLRFFAYHGLYAEEKKIGNEFELNLLVRFSPKQAVIRKLSDSVNYVQLYELVKEEMKQNRDLLETFVMELAEKIHLSFEGVQYARISIAKLHTPISHLQGDVTVCFEKDFPQ